VSRCAAYEFMIILDAKPFEEDASSWRVNSTRASQQYVYTFTVLFQSVGKPFAFNSPRVVFVRFQLSDHSVSGLSKLYYVNRFWILGDERIGKKRLKRYESFFMFPFRSRCIGFVL